MIDQIKSDWQRAKRTGQEPLFVVFWGFSFLAWVCLVAAVPLLLLECLK